MAPFTLATAIPSLARIRGRSASNTATLRKTLNNNLPTGSVESDKLPPRLSTTSFAVNSSATSRASRNDRADRSSFVITNVPPIAPTPGCRAAADGRGLSAVVRVAAMGDRDDFDDEALVDDAIEDAILAPAGRVQRCQWLA